MNKITRNLFVIVFSLFVFMTGTASAHQPRIVKDDFIKIENPEVSQAFYGELKGSPVEYQINSDRDFRLYVGILVPDISGIHKDISAEIYRLKDGTKESLAVLDGTKFEWTPFYEEFAKDNYFWGPEYQDDNSKRGVSLKGRLVPNGDYRIKVYSPNNQGKYSMAVGDIEAFPLKEIIRSMSIVPQLKLHFFDESFFKVILSPFVWGTILVFYLIGFIIGFLYRSILRVVAKGSPRGMGRNIGKSDRLIRAAIGIGLLIWAVSTTWSPILLILSGFTIFEAIFSWCGLYAALGKNSCPLR